MPHHDAIIGRVVGRARYANRLCLVPFLLTLLALAAPWAEAATKVWNNPAGGNWSTAANWTGGLPAPGDDVDITLAGTYTVALDVSTSIQSFALGGASGTQTLAIASGAVIMDGVPAAGGTTSTVNANGVVALSAGTIRMGASGPSAPYVVNVDGKLDWSGGTLAISNVAGSSVTISATGVLAMSGLATMLVDSGGLGSLINNGIAATWSGTGVLSIHQSHVVNNGTLTVAASSPGFPILNPDGGDFTNNGLVLFAGDPTVNAVHGIPTGAVVNHGTLRKNGSAGTMNVELDASAFINSGLVDVLSGTLAFVTVAGGDMGSSGASNTFNAGPAGAIVYPARAYLGTPHGFVDTIFSGPGPQTLAGGDFGMAGTITASNLQFIGGRIYPQSMTLVGNLTWLQGHLGCCDIMSTYPGSLTIAAGSTVDLGSGDSSRLISLCCLAVVQNFGTIRSSGGNQGFTLAEFTTFSNSGKLDVQAGNFVLGLPNANFSNSGTVVLPSGGGYVFSMGGGFATFSNGGTVLFNGNRFHMDVLPGCSYGYIQGGGVTDLGSGGEIFANIGGCVTVSGGIFKGNGLIQLPVTFKLGGTGTLAPGASPGRIEIGSYVQDGGTLAMELNGTVPGVTYDQLVTDTSPTLGGVFSVSLGFTPPLGTTFVILDNQSASPVTGTFTGLSEGATITVGATTLQISYVGGTGNDVTLTVVSGAAGATSTTVTAAPNPSAFGQNVTLTATVTGAAPTGTVQFRDGASNLGAPMPLTAGTATIATTLLAVASHAITATYSGDAANLSSTSAVVIHVVTAAGPPATQPIPALRDVLLVFLALLLAVTGWRPLRRRRR